MSIASTVNRNNYVGNGATDTYNYNFKIFQSSDLEVAERDLAGVVTIYTLNVDYTVTGVGNDAGGTIILTAGNLTSGFELAIRRKPPITQLTDIKNQGDFFPEVHENTFDKGTMIDQKQQDEIDRSLKIDVVVDPSTFDTVIEGDVTDAANAERVVMVNATNDGFGLGPSATEITTAAAATAASAAAAAASAAAAATSASNAATSETNAATSETNAATSEANALAAAEGLMWAEIVYVNFAASPVTITNADRAKYYVCDCTGGNIVINLPLQSSINFSAPFMLGFKKLDSSANTVTINRSGADTIDNAATSVILSFPDDGARFIADPNNAKYQTEKFGLPQNDLQTAEFHANGLITVDTDVDGRHYFPYACEIVNVFFYIGTTGTSGNTQIDLLYRPSVAGVSSSFLTTKCTFANTAADTVFVDSAGTVALQAGVTRPVMSSDPFPVAAGSVIRMDILQAATGSANVTAVVHYRRV